MPVTKQQAQQRKQTLLTRTQSAIVIVTFYVLYLLLLFFSDQKWFSPISGNDNAQFILNFLTIIMIVPIIVFVSREISDLCFPGHKAVFIYTASAIFTLTMGTSIFLLSTRHDIFTVDTSITPSNFDKFTFFLIISLSGIAFFTVLSTVVWVIMSRHIVYVGKRTKFWFPVLMLILNTFFVGFIYTTIIHSWTTYMFLMCTSVLCDVFAYLGGSWFGKHKLAPKISPKKTWEGLGFGAGVTLLILCGLISIFFFINGTEERAHTLYCFLGCQSCRLDVVGSGGHQLINTQPYYWAIYIPVIILIVCVSVSGDLFFSFVKRRFNIKDFSNLIPGHGGMIDRIDALVFTFTFYFIVTVVIQLIMLFCFNEKSGLMWLWNNETIPNFAF